jgi:hypothetical protein
MYVTHNVINIIVSVKVLEVVTFLTSHNLAGGGERISVPYATLSQRYDQLRCRGDSKYVAHKTCSDCSDYGRVADGSSKLSQQVILYTARLSVTLA